MLLDAPVPRTVFASDTRVVSWVVRALSMP
jgi:hypothetical protein